MALSKQFNDFLYGFALGLHKKKFPSPQALKQCLPLSRPQSHRGHHRVAPALGGGVHRGRSRSPGELGGGAAPERRAQRGRAEAAGQQPVYEMDPPGPGPGSANAQFTCEMWGKGSGVAVLGNRWLQVMTRWPQRRQWPPMESFVHWWRIPPMASNFLWHFWKKFKTKCPSGFYLIFFEWSPQRVGEPSRSILA